MMSKKITSINDLPGVGPATVEKLLSNGYDDLMSIAVTLPSILSDVTGLSESKCRNLIKVAKENLDGFDFYSLEKDTKKTVLKISTGSKNFDAILKGGFESGIITELFGRFGSAKSQLVMQACVNLQTIDENFKAIVIDTENSFSHERITDMAVAKNLDVKKVLTNIKIIRTFNSDHQMLMIDKAEKLIKEDKNYKLLVVDSIISHVRVDMQGRGKLAERQQFLNRMMHKLAKIAMFYDVVVLITNQVSSDPSFAYGDPDKPVGGNVVGHASKIRIKLSKTSKEWKVKIVDSNKLGDAETVFQVRNDGVGD